MKKLFGLMGVAAIAASLTACMGDPDLKAAQNYKLPGSDFTMQEILEKTYDHGEWVVKTVPEEFRGGIQVGKNGCVYRNFSWGKRILSRTEGC